MGDIDYEGMRERMDRVRLKQMLGEPLTHREQLMLQMEQHGFGCGVCHQHQHQHHDREHRSSGQDPHLSDGQG